MLPYIIKIPIWLDKLIITPVLLYRLIRYKYAFRRIALTKGRFAIVDPEMFYSLMLYKWHARRSAKTWYATHQVGYGKNRVNLHMHRLVMAEQLKAAEKLALHSPQGGVGSELSNSTNSELKIQNSKLTNLPCKLVIDHIDGNGLNNLKRNLRLATSSQNNCNRRLTQSRTSRFKGVDYRPSKKAYRARITVQKQKIFLGYFKSEIDAARAYDAAAAKYHGQFAVFNFPDEKLKP